MRTILRIMKTELRVLFFSPVAWILLVVFAFQVGLEFCGSLGDAIRSQGLGYSPYNLSMRLIAGSSGLDGGMLSNLYLYIPLLTMGLISRELGSGSIKLLYSSPISNFQIVIGKYLSIIAYSILLIILLLIPFFYALCVMKDPDVPAMLTATFGLFLTISTYAAIGIFMSSITKYQVVAAVGTLALFAILSYIGSVGQDIDFLRNITYWLSINGRSKVFIDGMICTKDVFYFLLIIFAFLTLTIIKLSGERLKLSPWNSAAKYFIVSVVVVFLGYISSLPRFIYYYDATATKTNTLTPESQDVMRRIKGDIIFTSYSNVLDDTWHKCSPSSRNYDFYKFERYLRFRPDMEVNYVFYYGKGRSKYLDEKYPNTTIEERFARICKVSDYNPKNFVSEKDIKDDISMDQGQFVRTIKANGRIAYLRKYDDSYVDPTEAEITAAFKTLVDKSPMIAFVTGHGERGAFDHGDKGYGPFATSTGFRNALINQGFSVKNIELNSEVADDVDVLVLSDMKSPLTAEEEVNFDAFLNKGGNILILGEPRRQANMNPIVAKLGLQFAEGVIVRPSREYTDEVVAGQVMPTALEVSPFFDNFIKKGYSVITPSACAVNIIEDKGFKVTEILASKPTGSWIEYETTDFAEEKSVLNPAKNEVEKSNSIMLHLNRKVGDKDQRIFVVGDADCLSSAELTKERAGLKSNNFGMITELFRNFSYNQYPVEMFRTRPADDKLYLSETGLVYTKIVMVWIIPLTILAFGILLLIRRKRQ